jgi:peptide/nickel transport system permease protein
MSSIALPRTQPVSGVNVKDVASKIARNFYVGRVFKAFVTIYLVSTISFFVVHLMPGSPVDVYIYTLMNQYGVSYETAKNQAAALFAVDVNQPLVLQYVDYLGQLAHGNLGNSLLSPGTSVASVMLEYMPWTLFSVGLALLISFVLGILLGMLMAYRRESALDHVLSLLGSIFHSVPNYIIGILLVVILGIQLNLIDIAKMRGSFSPGIQPGISLAFFADALVAQVAIAAGFAVGGSILIETLFVYQGIGWVLNSSIAQRDYTVMQGIFLVITTSVVVANLLADLLYGKIDPRVRIQGESGG